MKTRQILNISPNIAADRWLERLGTYPLTVSDFSHRPRSLFANAMRRFFKNKAAVASIAILFCVVIFSIFAPMISSYDFDFTDWDNTSTAPSISNGHFFGTDATGRDLFVRVALGGRISLLVGFLGALMAVVIGVLYGSISGFVGGATDAVMMRIIEILSSMPFMFFVILLVTFFGSNIFLIFVAIGAVSWLNMARIVRGQTLSLKNKEFVEAAHVTGVSTRHIITRHIIPNLIGVVMVYASLLVPGMILFESFLSFLGLGVQEPLSSWGSLLNDGVSSMELTPWILGFPAVFLVITLFCFNFIGDGLRDALDPKDVR